MTYIFSTNNVSKIEGSSILNVVLSNLKCFNPQAFSVAVDYNITDNEAMEVLKDQVCNNIKVLRVERDNLIKYSNEWLETWATKNNNYYSGQHDMLKQIKNGLHSTEKLCKKFARRFTSKAKRQYDIYGKEYPTVFDRTMLFTSTYSMDMFGDNCLEEEYAPIVNETYCTFKEFFELLAECLVICGNTIQKEIKIANDKGACGFLFDKQTRFIMDEFKDVLSYITGGTITTPSEDNPLFKKHGNQYTLVVDPYILYHKCSYNHLREYVCYILWEQMSEVKATDQEKKLFKGHAKDIPLARKVLMDFDNYIQKHNRKKMDPQNIALFIKYFNIGDIKAGLQYFKTLYNGNYALVGYSSVQTAYKNLSDDIFNYLMIQNIENTKKQVNVA